MKIEAEFMIKRTYKDLTKKSKDTVEWYTIDRDTARRLVERKNKTLRNLGTLSPIVVSVVEEHGMLIQSTLFRM